jgi:hypothetical protein
MPVPSASRLFLREAQRDRALTTISVAADGFVSARASRPLLVGDRRTLARLGHGAEGHGAAGSAPRPVAPASVDRSAAVSAAFPGRDEELRQGGMSWRW